MSRETARYTYTHGSRPEGCIVYDDDRIFHSHHDSDPARGQHNAFDLVRLHRFGHLDKDAGHLPISERPSQKAMTEFAEALPEIRAARAGAEFEDLGPLPAAELDWLDIPAAKPERFAILDHSAMMLRPRLQWIIPKLLPKAELAIIYGESGSGKSFLAYDIAAAIQQGIVWQGNRQRCIQGETLLIAAEGATGMRNRAEAYALRHPAIPVSALPSFMTEAPNFLLGKDVEAVAQRVLERYGRDGLLVLVLDTVSAATPGGNENSSEDMGQMLSNCKYLHRVTGATVVLIDHSGVATKERTRGWTGKKGACDAQIQVDRDGDVRSWHVAKLKDGDDDNTKYGFRLDVVNLRAVNDTSCVVEHSGSAPGAPKPSGEYEVQIVESLKGRDRISTAELTALVKAAIPKKVDGRDERGKSIKKALARLIDKQVVAAVRGTNDVRLIVTEDF